MAKEQETGFAARAFKALKVARPGAMSEKRDRTQAGPLVALKTKDGGLLTGAACDEKVADEVAANNREGGGVEKHRVNCGRSPAAPGLSEFLNRLKVPHPLH